MQTLNEPYLEDWQVRRVVTETLFETKPRFKGCPPVCLKANLPAFETKEQLYQWHLGAKETNPQYDPNPIVKVWQCETCQRFHFLTKLRPPSGSSSGSSRTR